MRILITGASGFAGRHLIRWLVSQASPDSVRIDGTVYGQEVGEPFEGVVYHPVDLMDYEAVVGLLQDVAPDCIYHLAAQSSPALSRKIPWQTLEGNIRIQFNVLQACVTLGIAPRVLVISSADIYCGVKPNELPLHEQMPLQPTNAYSLSKVTQDMMGLQYYLEHRLPIVRARPFNHIGRGQRLNFVAPDFAMQIARIEAGEQAPVIEVGNLEAQRDFTDVRDIIRAYALLMQKGEPGEVYNIASGKAYSIHYMLETLLSYAEIPITVRVEPSRLRAVDVPLIVGDYSKLKQATQWEPRYRFEDTLRDVLDDCRWRIANHQE